MGFRRRGATRRGGRAWGLCRAALRAARFAASGGRRRPRHVEPPGRAAGPPEGMCGRPLGCKSEELRSPTIGSIAVMCPACWRGSIAAGPDGIRDPAPNRLAASQAAVLDGFSGSSVRPMVISFSSHTLASTRGLGSDRPLPVCPATRHRGPCGTGHPVDQSRPKPRGGSIASSSERSRSAIARKASAVALSC